MAGEVIQEIKKRENEASELIARTHVDAKKILEKTRDAKADLIREKDVLLEKEEVRIRDRYAKETEDIVEQIEEEEKSTIQKLTNACEKNIGKVVDFIASEIVKE